MIQIKEIVNTIFTSKTYILYQRVEGKAWLVDIGDVEPVEVFLVRHRLTLEGVFLTHAHFDHIYGLEALVHHYPACKVYCTEYCKAALANEKLNMSRYHGTPINYSNDNVLVVHEGEQKKLFDEGNQMVFYETPGHNPGCLTMVLGDCIFTGDAYIQGVGINTQLPHANKEDARVSLERILRLAEGKKIFSGHKV